ncbi:MAG: hypothetical protein WAW37_16800 [Syntrophobacteraceae bacterium]
MNGITRWFPRTKVVQVNIGQALTDRGKGAQEREYGADFLGVLDINLSDFSVKKGFLSQAKIIEPDRVFPRREYERMHQQCEEMLWITPDAFVFIYSTQGIRVIPAISIVSATHCNPHELYSRSLARFFEEHFQSFIGDRRLGAPNIDVLEVVQREYRARAALYLSAEWIG